MLLIGVTIGVSIAAMAATGLLAMAVYVAATESDRHSDSQCIEQDGYPQRLR